jgi:HTH-type transcriptional regulator/antitoxin HigA
MKPKVLKTDRDFKAALAYVECLIDQSSPDESELELWSLLVENYEQSHFPIATPDPIEAIRFRLEQAGLQTADLLPYLQSKSKISEVMNRKRPLSLSMIRALHDGLKIPAAVLVQLPATTEARKHPVVLSRKNPPTKPTTVSPPTTP